MTNQFNYKAGWVDPTVSPEPNFNEIWTYKDTRYRVNSVLQNNLSQYRDEWHPTVRYTLEPPNHLVFYRSLPEFVEKFLKE